MNLAILNCAELVTLAGPPRPRVRDELKELSIIPNGAMLVRSEKIERIGPRDQIETHPTPDIESSTPAAASFCPASSTLTPSRLRSKPRRRNELRSRGATYEQIAASGGGIGSAIRKTREPPKKI